MPDPNTLMKAGTLFPTELVPELFNTVRGHSALAKLSGMKPIPFTGTEEFIFSMDGEASLVAEGGAKPAGDANLTPKVIKPLKFVYQHRMTDEFKRCSNLKRVQYLEAFAEGGAVKMARALDIAAFHGVNPATGSAASFRATNSFDGVLTPVLLNGNEDPDETLEGAIAALKATERDVTGMVFAPAFAGSLAALVNNAGNYKYPEFRFGANPGSFYGMGCDVNGTLPSNPVTDTGYVYTDMALAGDFKNAFRWGYADRIPLKVIEYGDPDGLGRDLQQYNEICLRIEVFMGWGILDAGAFTLIQSKASA